MEAIQKQCNSIPLRSYLHERLPNMLPVSKQLESLSKNNLDGKRLTHFFKETGVRREGLELLVDLLFVKIIAIY